MTRPAAKPKRMELTDSAVARLTPDPNAEAKGGRVVWDTKLKGFGVRLLPPGKRHPKGLKTYLFKYRVGGQVRKPALGVAGPGACKKARAEALRLKSEATKGNDAVASERAARQGLKAQEAAEAANTVAGAVALFMERHVQRHNRASTARMVEGVFKAEVLPKWGSRPLASIGRKDVLALLDRIMDRGAAYMANRTLAHVRKLFNWCMERGILEANPAAGIKAPGAEATRDRVLADDEVRALYTAFEGLGFPFGPLYRLLLVTGQRRGEVAAMRRGDVDHEKKLWTLPAEATKAGRVHEVPLSDMAVELIAGLPQVPGAGEYLFSATGERAPSGFSRAKAQADKLVAEAGAKVAPWRIHDLRRTAASGMARLGVAPHVLSRVLNHAPGASQGVTAIYNRHGYTDEKRHALDLWARHLGELLAPAPENVVPMRRKGDKR